MVSVLTRDGCGRRCGMAAFRTNFVFVCIDLTPGCTSHNEFRPPTTSFYCLSPMSNAQYLSQAPTASVDPYGTFLSQQNHQSDLCQDVSSLYDRSQASTMRYDPRPPAPMSHRSFGSSAARLDCQQPIQNFHRLFRTPGTHFPPARYLASSLSVLISTHSFQLGTGDLSSKQVLGNRNERWRVGTDCGEWKRTVGRENAR